MRMRRTCLLMYVCYHMYFAAFSHWIHIYLNMLNLKVCYYLRHSFISSCPSRVIHKTHRIKNSVRSDGGSIKQHADIRVDAKLQILSSKYIYWVCELICTDFFARKWRICCEKHAVCKNLYFFYHFSLELLIGNTVYTIPKMGCLLNCSDLVSTADAKRFHSTFGKKNR